jgi:hypothetical protein
VLKIVTKVKKKKKKNYYVYQQNHGEHNMYSKQQDLFNNLNNETNVKLPSVYTKTTLYGKWATLHNHTTQKPQQT